MEIILAPFQMENILVQELSFKGIKVIESHGRLIFIEDFVGPLWFTQVRIKGPKLINFKSIKEGSRELKDLHPLWDSYSIDFHRRTDLIKSYLPKTTKMNTPYAPNKSENFGFFVLVENNKMYAGISDKPTPLGEAKFMEDQINPPSRAYLKLWEAFTFVCSPPKPNQFCLELGASPGGWSWCLVENLKAQLVAIDRSELRQDLMKNPKIKFIKGDAFNIKQIDYPNLKWLLSDIICYPQKLYEFITPWANDRNDLNILVTIKLQGKIDFELLEKFQNIKNAKIIHLFHNKHELTFYRPSSDEGKE